MTSLGCNVRWVHSTGHSLRSSRLRLRSFLGFIITFLLFPQEGGVSHPVRYSVWSLVSGSLVDSVSEVAVGWGSHNGCVTTGGWVGERWAFSGFAARESSPHVGLWRVGSGTVVDSWIGRGRFNSGWGLGVGIEWTVDGDGTSDSEEGEEFHY